MKILVLSDSHSGLSFMRRCILATKPDQILHLGDYSEDAQAMAEEFPQIPMAMVAGNCDRLRGDYSRPETLELTRQGCRLLLTHGHLQRVKSGTEALVYAARKANVDVVLYGHTHIPDCRQEPDGMWVLNPGSCRSFGGTCGWLEIEEGKITACRVLQAGDLGL